MQDKPMKHNQILILIGITVIIAGAAFAQQQSTAASASDNPTPGCGMGRGTGPVNGMARGMVKGMANRLVNGPRHGRGGDCNRGGNAPDVTKSATISGQLKSFEGGPGKGRPTLILATSAGDKTFLVGPYRVLSEANIEFVPGAAFTVTAAPNANDDWVAITIKDDASGKELALRDAQTGRPAGGGCRGRRS